MKEFLLPSTIICLLLTVLCIVKDTEVYFKALTFQYKGIGDRIVSVIAWVFLAGAVSAVVTLCDILIK